MNYLGCSMDDVDCLIDTDAATVVSAFGSLYPWWTPPCREGCSISPTVDKKILPKMISGMFNSDTARRVPTMQGWCKDDGAPYVSMDIDLNGYTMTEAEYELWWSRFRATGFEAERMEYFNPNNYEAVGSSSP
jgi:hypothetical protein